MMLQVRQRMLPYGFQHLFPYSNSKLFTEGYWLATDGLLGRKDARYNLREIRTKLGKGKCPLCLGRETVEHMLWIC
jgi:ribulose bisphosphate carboxylase small subunit